MFCKIFKLDFPVDIVLLSRLEIFAQKTVLVNFNMYSYIQAIHSR
jgi:hypothetical protein